MYCKLIKFMCFVLITVLLVWVLHYLFVMGKCTERPIYKWAIIIAPTVCIVGLVFEESVLWILDKCVGRSEVYREDIGK